MAMPKISWSVYIRCIHNTVLGVRRRYSRVTAASAVRQSDCQWVAAVCCWEESGGQSTVNTGPSTGQHLSLLQYQMETFLHSLPHTVERNFKRDQVHDILKDLKPQLDTWGIVKIPVKGVKPRLKDADRTLDKAFTLRTKTIDATNPKSLLQPFEEVIESQLILSI